MTNVVERHGEAERRNIKGSLGVTCGDTTIKHDGSPGGAPCIVIGGEEIPMTNVFKIELTIDATELPKLVIHRHIFVEKSNIAT